MKGLALSILAVLLTATVYSSFHSYRMTEDSIVSDLNQALTLTLQTTHEDYLTPDTLRIYRSYLREETLRQCASLSYTLPGEKRPDRSSRIMKKQHNGRTLYLRGYANCSVATVFALSDQRLPLMLTVLTMLWAGLGHWWLRRRPTAVLAEAGNGRALCIGSLSWDAASHSFFTGEHKEVHFTPMQRQLMELFISADCHMLTKESICQHLWPRKEDANETLYTLIRRLKQTLVENDCQVTITSDRGRSYRLCHDCNSSTKVSAAPQSAL